MKRTYISLLLVVCSFIAFSCKDDRLVDNTGYEEGIPVSVNVSFKPNTPEVVTRAGENVDEYADKVYDITVFAFNKNGDRIGYQIFPITEEGTSGTLKNFKTESGANYIYAIANLSSSNYRGLAEKLENCLDKTTFLNFSADLSQDVIHLIDNKFLMSGMYEETTTNLGYVNVPTSDATLSGKIVLSRVVASVKFKVGGDEGVSFTPQFWQVVNVPHSSYLFGKDIDLEGVKYFSEEEYTFAVGQNEFTFYMMENRKTASKEIAFKDRYAQMPSQSTYLILKGSYEGPADKYEDFSPDKFPSTSNVVGNVTYYIPLGDASNSSDKISNTFTDFSTERNTQYNYTIKVRGVNDIVVEVVKKDPTSVADGDLTYTEATSPVLLLDAHYEARVLTFNWSDVNGKKWGELNNLTYKVKTPKTGFAVQGPNDNVTNLDDKWISFKINDVSKNNYNDVCCDYPGDNGTGLLSIAELIEKIKDNKNYKNGKFLVTAFIDEYYYTDEDWWEFANKPNRDMLILCKTQAYTDGGNNSSLTDAAYVLSQRSIQTYYATDGTVKYAVGIEWKNETDIFEKSEVYKSSGTYNYGVSKSSTNRDGRQNMIEQLKSYNSLPYWNKVPYFTKDLSSYSSAYNACVSRNRNTVATNKRMKEDEIKWFLPSLEQYQDAIMGQSGYASEAILFPATTGHTLHYYCSNGGYVLWSEEGSSYSTMGAGHNGYNYHSIRCFRYLGPKEDNSLSSIASNQAPIVEVKEYYLAEDSKSYNRLNVINLNSGAYRKSFASGELGMHTEVQENNKPYTSFLVYDSNAGNNSQWGWRALNMNSKYTEYIIPNKCPSGWRVPNEKELTLMMRNKTALNLSGSFLSRTRYSGNPAENDESKKKYYGFDGKERYGFIFDGTFTRLAGAGGSPACSVRCVRDVD